MLATVDRHMQAAQSSPANSGTRTQAMARALATQNQQVAVISAQVWRSGRSRGRGARR